MADNMPIPDVVLELIARFSRRRRRLALLRGAAEAFLVAFVAFALVALADAFLHPSAGTLAGFSMLAWASTACVFAARGLLPALRRAPPAVVARDIERAQSAPASGGPPGAGGRGGDSCAGDAETGPAESVESPASPLEERLSSAVELAERAPPGVSPWMINRTIALAACGAAALDPVKLLDSRPAVRAAWRACAAVAVAVVACVFPDARTFALRALLPGANLARPSAVRLLVSPGDCHVSEGTSLVITVVPSRPVERARLRVKWDDGLAEELPLRVVPPEESTGLSDRTSAEPEPRSEGRPAEVAPQMRFAIEFPALARGFTYSAIAPGGESPKYRVRIVSPPRLRSVELRVKPPAYTGAPERTVVGGDAEVLAGSEVQILALLEGPEAASAAVVFRTEPSDDADPRATAPMTIEGKLARAVLAPDSSVRWRLRLVGADGLVAEPPREWELKVVPDAPPSAHLSMRGQSPTPEPGGPEAFEAASEGALLVGRDELLLLDVAAEDDVALRAIALVTRDESLGERVQELPVGREPVRAAGGPAALDLGRLGARTGDEIELFARAVDVGGQTGESPPVRLVVASFEGSCASAAAARMRIELKRLIAQEEILRREHRSWSELRRSFRAEDPHGHAPTLAVSRGRLAEVAAAVAASGERVRSEALGRRAGSEDRKTRALEEALVRPLLHVGDALVEWARSHGDAFAQAVELALGPSPEGRPDAQGLAVGADTIASASGDLERLRSRLGIVVARLEAEALVARSESASARSARTVPVVRGYRGWGAKEARSGLLGRFFPNLDLAPPHVFETRGAPDLTDFQVPGAGAQNWSVRYSGELRLPKDGTYVFTCIADDGLRLRIAGRTVIDAWKDQPPTTYTAALQLRAGWTPVELEMYQRGGGSRLWFGLAPEGGQAASPAQEDVRHVMGEADRKALAALMSSLPRELLERADEKLARDYETLSAVPETIAQMAEDSAVDRLRNLSREQQRAASVLRDAVRSARAAGWVEEDLERASSYVPPLVWAARAARDILRDALAQISPPKGFRRGGIAEIRREVSRAAERLERLETASRTLSPDERAAAAERERAILESALDRIGRRLDEEEARLLADAARADANPGERAASLEARRVLEDEAEKALAKAVEALPGEATPQRLRGALGGQLGELDRALEKAEREALRAEESRLAAEAAEALDSLSEFARRRDSRDVLGERLAYRELAEEVGKLARDVREAARFDQAERLEEALGERPSDLRPARLEGELRDLASRGLPPEAIQPRPVADRLAREAPARAREALEEARHDLALAAERLRSQGREAEALARERLARDIGETLAEGSAPRGEDLKAFAERAAALEGARGEEARRAAERAASEEPAGAAPSAARALEELARRADRAANEKPLRPELVKDLEALAGMASAPPEERAAAALAKAAAFATLAAEAEREARALQELREELARAEKESEKARQEFAALEDEIARSLGGLADEARRAAAAAGKGELASAAERLASALPEEASRVAELAREAARPAAAPAARENTVLARAARERADALSQGLARPLAESYLASAPEAPVPAVSELGRELAGLAAEQRKAAELLEESAAREDRLRRELAEEALAAGARAEELGRALSESPREGRPMDPAAAASQAAKAGPPVDLTSSQAEADRLQRAANEAQKRADALHEEARRLSDEAAQARYAAENLGANPWEREESRRRAEETARAAQGALENALTSAQQAIAAQEAANKIAQRAAEAGLRSGGHESAETPSLGELAQSAQAASNMHQALENAAQAAELARELSPEAGAAMERKAIANSSHAREALSEATRAAPAVAEALARRLAEAAASARAEARRLATSEAAAGHEETSEGGEPGGPPTASHDAAQAGEPSAHGGEEPSHGPAEAAEAAGAPEHGGAQGEESAQGQGPAQTPHAGAASALAREGSAQEGGAHGRRPGLAEVRPGGPEGEPHGRSSLAAGEQGQEGSAGGRGRAETPYMRASRAASRALGMIGAAPGEGESYRRAARELARAAATERYQAAAGPVPGSAAGRAQASSEAQGGQGASQAGAQGLSQPGGSGSGQKQGRELGELAGFGQADPGADQAAWARLPERVRQAIRSGGVEKFAEEHRRAIRAYFRRLGEER